MVIRLRILLLQDAEWRKKGPHQQHHLMELLSLLGHQVLVIGFDQLWREEEFSLTSARVEIKNLNRFYKHAHVDYVRPFFIKLPLFDYLSFAISSKIEIKKQIQEFKPDIIIGYSSVLSNYWGAVYAKKNKIPYIYYWVDIVHTLSLSKPLIPPAIFFEKAIIKNSNLILTINEGLKDYLIDFGANPDRIRVIPGGIDFNRFNSSKVDSHAVREKYGLSKDDLVLFFMGWIYEFTGLKEVIQGLIKVKDTNPHLKMLIVGEGDYYPALKDLVRINGLEDRVILTGKRPYEEIPELISAADICLLPAYNNEVMKDIVPIKMYEYLAMNKPVISTKLSGIFKEFGVDNGVLYVDNSDMVIEKVMSLTDKQIGLRKVQAEHFISQYSWYKIVQTFEKILFNLKEGAS